MYVARLKMSEGSLTKVLLIQTLCWWCILYKIMNGLRNLLDFEANGNTF